MRVALISDVHANLSALEAVLAHAEAAGAEATWNMGDTVGYGPDPDAVVSRLVAARAASVMGNHDAAALGLMSVEDFNPVAAEAALWTARTISPTTKEYLAALPEVERDDSFTRVHGTLRDPLWEYLVTVEAADGHFEVQETAYSVVGHTHVPLLVRELAPGRFVSISPGEAEVVELGAERLCINPGGVGQPRDGDPRACYALLDTTAATVTFHRVAYDLAITQARIRALGLPEPLAARLARGR